MIRLFFALITLLLAAPAFAVGPASENGASDPQAYIYAEAPMDRTVGSENAPHTLILYASNVCPHCGQWFAQDWPVVKRDLIETEQLRVVFRPLPSQPLQLSVTGFIMAECATPENYMTVIEDQFARQNTILTAVNKNDGAMIKTQYDSVARIAGLEDEAAIAACLANEANLKAIQRSADLAAGAGIANIPSFIFNGSVMSGAHDANAIKGWVQGRSSARN